MLGTKANRMRFKALSLIDITKTGVSRNKEAEDQKAVAQFANYMTVENCLQLRSNIKILTMPKGKKMDISNLKFGDNYRGEQMVWEFIFKLCAQGMRPGLKHPSSNRFLLVTLLGMR